MQYTSLQYEQFWTSELDKAVRSGDRLRAPCPVHAGDGLTLSVNLATGFAHCFKCNADGEGWSMIDFAMARYGYDKQSASEYVRNILGTTNGSRQLSTAWPYPFGRPHAITSDTRVLSRLADRIESYRDYLDITATPGKPGWEPYALYIYLETKALKVRWRHKETGVKRLCWFALTEKGGWKNPSKMGLITPPYRAGTLKGAKEVWLLNGEKAVDRAIEAWKVTATCLPNGEAHWRVEYLAHFQAAETVYLVMDNDPTGSDHGRLVGSQLAKGGVAVHLVTLPDLPPKGDLYDFIEAGGTFETCREIARNAPLASAKTPVKEKRSRMPAPVPYGELDGTEPDLLPYELNDSGNAQRLARYGGNVLRYARELDSPWLFFDKTHWRSGNVEVAYQVAQDALHILQKQASKLGGETAEKIWGFANSKLNAGGIHAMLDLSRGILRISPNEFDRRPYLVNCSNGTFDLESGEFRPHRPEDLLTRCFPYAYDATLPPPATYLKALDEWMGGGAEASITDLTKAEEMSAYIRRLCGATLIGSTRYKFFVIIFGSGNNGKTTFLTIQQAILGPYAVTLSPNTLTRSWGRNQNNVDADIARTWGARAIYVAEPSEKVFDTGLIKKLTQGEAAIVGVFKGRQPFEFMPTATLIIEVNDLPTFEASDKAFTDRMHLLHFSRSFPLSVGKSQRDLIWPELAQIFNMQITDAREVVREGLQRPLADAKEQLRLARDRQARENDGLEPFVEEYFQLGSDEHVTLAEIEGIYRPWCERHHLRVLPRNHLSRQLCEREGIMRGNDPKDHRTPAWLKGIGLKPAMLAGKAPRWEKPTDD